MTAQSTPNAHFTARTAYCADLSEAQLNQTVTINGWVAVNRDLGGLVFVEIRDRSGVMQIVADPQKNPNVHEVISRLRSEDVVSVTGPITARPTETINPNLATGKIEIYPTAVELISKAKTPPFLPEDAGQVDEAVRLKYRYIDLRGPVLQHNLKLRHKVVNAARNFLDDKGFYEIETPMLIKSTPEGARDYLVPSRVQAGAVYALPQSPQLFKQLLMVGGMERYYQIARCFRDEDLRSDRQPEFTQVDLEMAFVHQPDVMNLVEGLVKAMFETAGLALTMPLKQMPFAEAMGKYGSDKPDLRFGLELIDFTDIMAASGFKAFAGVVEQGGIVKGLCVPNTGHFSRKELDDTRAMAESWGAKGLAYIVYADGELKSPITKFFTESELAAITERAGATTGCTLFFVADKPTPTNTLLGRLRLHFGKTLGLIDESKHEMFWVVDFPLFEELEDGGISPAHHPFTSPHPDDIALLATDPKKVRAVAYDLVYNGEEIGGGSIRIHSRELQQQIFELLGFSPEDIQEKFGFLIDAFQYGVPPHGGLALGLDRVIALLCGSESIRDVMAFPKNNQAQCLLTGAPAAATDGQYKELHIRSAQLVKK